MQTTKPPWWHSNQYAADSACLDCGGIIRCEVWCSTECPNVRYAQQAVLDPAQLSIGDQLILHALGVAWNTTSSHPDNAEHCMTNLRDQLRLRSGF